MTASKNRSVFFDEWKACLREHYLHVVTTDDHVTEPTLRDVLIKTGFTPADINDLYIEAKTATGNPIEALPYPETHHQNDVAPVQDDREDDPPPQIIETPPPIDAAPVEIQEPIQDTTPAVIDDTPAPIELSSNDLPDPVIQDIDDVPPAQETNNHLLTEDKQTVEEHEIMSEDDSTPPEAPPTTQLSMF